MKTKHTPGPWIKVYNDEDDHYEVIAKPDGIPGTRYIAKEICQGEDDGEADATLVAAAPVMLEKLQFIFLQAVDDDTTEDDMRAMIDQMREAALSGITQAIGES